MELLLLDDNSLFHVLNELLDISDPLLFFLVQDHIILYLHQPTLLERLDLLLSVHAYLLQVHFMIHLLIIALQLKLSSPFLAHSLLLNLKFIMYAFFLLPELGLGNQPLLLLLCLHVIFQFVPDIQPNLVHLVVGKLLELLNVLKLLICQLCLENL